MRNKNMDKKDVRKNPMLTVILKMALTLAALLVIFFVGSIAAFLLSAADIHLPLAYVIGYLLPALLLPAIWLARRKRYLKGWLAIAVLCAAVLGVDYAVVRHIESIRVDTTRYLHIINDFTEYFPFEEDSRIVKYDSETLELTGDLPLIDGSIAFYPLFSAYVNAVYPDTTEFFSGSFDHVRSWGYEYLAEKESDIFISMTYPTQEQTAYAEANAVTYEYTTIGSEALVFIVHKDNPVEQLTAEQIRGIYSGEITNWKEVGGRNEKIVAYQNEAGSDSQEMMARFMGETPLMQAPTERVYDNLYAWVEEVAIYRNNPNSIGFSFRYCVKDNPDIRMIAVDGAAPTLENMKNGSYPAVTPVFAVTCEENTNENVDTLLAWMLSQEGQDILEQTGYAGVSSEADK